MSVYHSGRIRADDLREAPEFSAGQTLGVARPAEPPTRVVNATHFGVLSFSGDAVLVLTGQVVGEKPPKPKCYVGNRRADSIDNRRKGRSRRLGGRWHRIIEAVRDSRDIIGGMDVTGEAAIGLNPTVVAPNEVAAELVMAGEASLVLPGGVVLAVLPGAGLAIEGGSQLTGAGAQIHAGELRMVGEATVRMRGTGGLNASLDPDQRRGGIVAIGIRGGHS